MKNKSEQKGHICCKPENLDEKYKVISFCQKDKGTHGE